MYPIEPNVPGPSRETTGLFYDNPDALFDQLVYEIECGERAVDADLRRLHYATAVKMFRVLDMSIVRTGRVPERWRVAVELGSLNANDERKTRR